MRPIAFHGERVHDPRPSTTALPRDSARCTGRTSNGPRTSSPTSARTSSSWRPPTPPDRVRAARVACLSGSGFRIAARLFILATGGIENARLLLLANRAQPAGLGNGSDLVGRYFMEHLYLDAAATIRRAGRRHRRVLHLRPPRPKGGACAESWDSIPSFAGASVSRISAPFSTRRSWGSAAAFWRSLVSELRQRRLPAGALSRLRSMLEHFAVAAAARSGTARTGRGFDSTW